MYWTLFKVLFALFVPVPVSPKITRATQAENTWILTCNGFTTLFQEAKVFWKSPALEQLLGTSYESVNVTPSDPSSPSRPDEVRTRRSSIRPGVSVYRSD